jgi:hypothetical protein
MLKTTKDGICPEKQQQLDKFFPPLNLSGIFAIFCI